GKTRVLARRTEITAFCSPSEAPADNAAPRMAPGFAALTVGVVVSLCLQIYGESLSQPCKVRFVADIIIHVLHWMPGVNHASDTLYDVEYKVYGTPSWTAVPDCTGISGHSCILTNETMEPSLRYYARVRAVSGNRTSRWTRTNAFSPKEATLRLSDATLSVTGNTIHVSLQQLILRVGNQTVSYKDIQKYGRQYRTYVRRMSDHLQVRQPALVPSRLHGAGGKCLWPSYLELVELL
ncbi:interleukin 22 receptor, alpha 2, partial [Chelydra serpentina]